MSSNAKRIRAAVVEGLKAEMTTAGDRVYGNRTRPVWKDTMPVLLVFTREERAEVFQVSPRVYRRILTLAVVAVDHDNGSAAGPVDDRLDDLAAKVERFFFRDPRLGLGAEGPAFELEDSRLESVELVTFELEGKGGERPLAGQQITFAVRYLEEAPEGESEDCEPFKGAGISWHLTPGDGREDARDRVDLAGS